MNWAGPFSPEFQVDWAGPLRPEVSGGLGRAGPDSPARRFTTLVTTILFLFDLFLNIKLSLTVIKFNKTFNLSVNFSYLISFISSKI